MRYERELIEMGASHFCIDDDVSDEEVATAIAGTYFAAQAALWLEMQEVKAVVKETPLYRFIFRAVVWLNGRIGGNDDNYV